MKCCANCSITLESLVHAQSETNGENIGGGGTDGETGRGGNTNNGNAYNWKTIRKFKWVFRSALYI